MSTESHRPGSVRRASVAVLALLLSVSALLVGAPGALAERQDVVDRAHAPRVAGSLRVAPSPAGAGSRVRLTGTTGVREARLLKVERFVHRRWLRVVRTRSTARGTFAVSVTAPLLAGRHRVRVRVLPTRTRPGRVTPERILTVRSLPRIVPTTMWGRTDRHTSDRLTVHDRREGTWRLVGPRPTGLRVFPDGLWDLAATEPWRGRVTVEFRDAEGITSRARVAVEIAPAPWSRLDPTSSSSCGLRSDRSAWCWGRNEHGQVGDGTREARPRPTRVAGSWGYVDTDGRTTCGIGSLDPAASDGVHCWGDGASGQLGNGSYLDSAVPVRLPLEGHWVDLRVGGGTVCALQADGSGWCWGDGDVGQLGDGYFESSAVPVRVPGEWRSIVPDGYGTVCGIKVDSTGWCWGWNHHHQLGSPGPDSAVPVQLPGWWRQLEPESAALTPTTCGIRTDDTGWCWGANDDGQVGSGTVGATSPPVQVGTRLADLRTVAHTTCALSLTGGLACWGLNDRGQVGDGSRENRLSPVPVASGIASMSVGALAVCRITTAGALTCAGAPELDGLPAGAPPGPVPGTWRAVRSGHGTVCALRREETKDGWCWGLNETGAVGDGTRSPREEPVELRWP